MIHLFQASVIDVLNIIALNQGITKDMMDLGSSFFDSIDPEKISYLAGMMIIIRI
jgi:hypothetical protein